MVFFQRRSDPVPARRTIHLRVFAAFIAAGLVPLLLGIFLHSQHRSILATVIEDSRTATLTLGTRLLESRLQEIESLAIRLAIDPAIQEPRRFSGPIEGTLPIRLLESNLQLLRQTSRDGLVGGVWVYYPSLDFIVGSNANYPFLEEQYGRAYAFGDLTYAQFRLAILTQRHDPTLLSAMDVIDATVSRRFVPYVRSLPFGSAHAAEMLLIVFIEESAIGEILDSVRILDGGFAAVLDHAGTVIASRGELPEIAFREGSVPTTGQPDVDSSSAEGDFLLTRATTEEPVKLVLASGTPVEIALNSLNRANRVALVVLVGSLIGFALVSGALSARLSRPFDRVVSRLRRQYRGGERTAANPFEQVNLLLDRMFEERTALEEQMTSRRKVLIETWLRMSMDGGTGTPDLLESVRRDLGYAAETCRFCVVLCRIGPVSSTDFDVELLTRTTVLIDESFREVAKVATFTLTPQVVAILVTSPGDAGELRTIIDGKVSSLLDGAVLGEAFQLFFGVGRVMDRLDQVHQSYREALHVLEAYGDDHRNRLVHYEETQFPREPYTVSPGTVSRLIQHVRAGSPDEVRKLVDDVLPGEAEVRRLSADTITLLVHELWLALSKFVCCERARRSERDLDLDDPVLPASALPHDRLTAIVDEYVNTARRISAAITPAQSDLVVATKAYLEGNYRDPNITLSSVAEIMGVSPNHLSRTFSREETGGFHSYLSAVRLAAAAELLAQDEADVAATWRAAGFASYATFRRVFKSRYGVTPVAFARRARIESSP
jgi:AraC-like DNA-binding protein